MTRVFRSRLRTTNMITPMSAVKHCFVKATGTKPTTTFTGKTATRMRRIQNKLGQRHSLSLSSSNGWMRASVTWQQLCTLPCKWLFRHERFRAWEDESRMEEHNGFLWIKGKPGCGKSTIMKEALAWTNRNQSNRKCITISYFFNARAPDSLENSSLGLYRSLVHQILLAIPNLVTHFCGMFS